MNRVILFLTAIAIGIFFMACGNAGSGKESESKESESKKLEGKEVIVSYANGLAQMERDFKMVDGKRKAVYEREFYEDGNLLKEGPLSSMEKRDGTWKSYYRDGSLWSEGDYNNGIREGSTVTYFANGQKRYEGQFTRAQKSGVWKFWDENGESESEIDYDKRKNVKITIDQ